MRSRSVATALAALALVLVPSPARAHTDLVQTDPRDGSRLDATPTSVTLTFNEEVSPELSTFLLSVGDTGNERRSVLTVRRGETPSTLTATVPRDALAAGGADTVWVTTFRVTSQDGHSVDGSVTFRAPGLVGPQGDSSTSPSASGPSSPSAGSDLDAPPPSVPETLDASPASTSAATSTLVIGGITLLGVALGCGWLVRARRRSLDS